MTEADASVQAASSEKGLLARYPLIFFFLIAYALSWLLWMFLVLSEDGAGLLPFSIPLPLLVAVFAIASFGPTLSACIMTRTTEGRASIRRLLRRYVLWRVGLRWYLFVLIAIPVIMVLGAIVLPGALASFQPPDPLLPDPLSVLAYLGIFVLGLVFGGPLGEEPGWRGFALPRLQRLHGPLVGSLILAPLWGLWHLPVFWIPDWGTPPTILNIVLFVLAAIAFTIILTWVFNNTKGSLLIAMLAHASINTSYEVLVLLFPAPIVTDYGGSVPILIGYGAVALVLVALTRGHLGYQHYRQEEGPDPATAPT